MVLAWVEEMPARAPSSFASGTSDSSATGAALRGSRAGDGASRDTVAAAIQATFTDSSDDTLLRRILVDTYLEPRGGHVFAMTRANMSRSSFYRHLQRARQRLAAHWPDRVEGSSS